MLASWTDGQTIGETKPPIITSVGWLVQEDKDAIRLSGLWNFEDDSGNAIQIIPKGCVVEMNEVKEE